MSWFKFRIVVIVVMIVDILECFISTVTLFSQTNQNGQPILPTNVDIIWDYSTFKSFAQFLSEVSFQMQVETLTDA